MSVKGRTGPDITGKRFGKLTVVCRNGRIGSEAAWKCACECGNTTTVRAYSLKSGTTKSCGCGKGNSGRKMFTTHGMSKTPVYRIWKAMMCRCYQKRNRAYPRYGGRGIDVCDRWHDFTNFYSDMGERPSGTSIDRIDNNKGYSPDNCRWATNIEQARNTRRNVSVSYGGKEAYLSELAERAGISYYTLYCRYKRMGWNIEDAVSLPLRHGGGLARGRKSGE